jgi:hypothetical protein
MGNVNDELTDLLLELNRYCFDRHVEFELEIKEDTVKNSIKKMKRDGETIIHVVLGDVEDNDFLNKVTNFMIKLRSKPS